MNEQQGWQERGETKKYTLTGKAIHAEKYVSGKYDAGSQSGDEESHFVLEMQLPNGLSSSEVKSIRMGQLYFNGKKVTEGHWRDYPDNPKKPKLPGQPIGPEFFQLTKKWITFNILGKNLFKAAMFVLSTPNPADILKPEDFSCEAEID